MKQQKNLDKKVLVVGKKLNELFSPETLLLLSDIAEARGLAGLEYVAIMALSTIVKGTSGSPEIDEMLHELAEMIDGQVGQSEKSTAKPRTSSRSAEDDGITDFLSFATKDIRPKKSEKEEPIDPDDMEEFEADDDEAMANKPKDPNLLNDLKDFLKNIGRKKDEEEN